MSALPVGTRVTGHTSEHDEGFVTEVLSPTKVVVRWSVFRLGHVVYTLRPSGVWVARRTHEVGVLRPQRLWVSSWQPRLDIRPIDVLQ